MRDLTYLEGFGVTVRRYPEKEALVTLDGRSLTYRNLDERSDALAAALEARIPGRRCAVLTQNRVAAVEAMLAGMKRGRATVQLPTRGAVGELVSAVETGGAVGLVFDPQTAGLAAEVRERTDVEVAIGVEEAGEGGGEEWAGEESDVGDGEVYGGILDDANPTAAPAAPTTDPPESAVFFTSGTTGAPKAILVDGSQAYLAAVQPALEMSLTASDRALVCTPWYHMVTTEAWMLPHLLVGATLVVQPTFDPPGALAAIEDHAVTGILAVPAQLEAMLAAEADADAGYDTGSLSYVRTGGAVVPESLVERVRERFTEGVFNTYGLTEGVGNVTFAYPDDQFDHPGTIGKASFLWETRVVEPAEPPDKPDPHAEVDPGGTGELLGRSLQMTDGYLDRPEATDALFVDGWLRTGDVVRVDDEGYLYVVDRIDNMILTGGENVYPEQVQRALRDHPGVRDAGVVGLDDERWGQVVAAAVVADGDVTEADLERHCRDHDTLADFKRPRQWVFVEDLPRSATGTLLRGEVVEMFED